MGFRHPRSMTEQENMVLSPLDAFARRHGFHDHEELETCRAVALDSSLREDDPSHMCAEPVRYDPSSVPNTLSLRD